MKTFLAALLLAAGLLCPWAHAQQNDVPKSKQEAFDSPENRAAGAAVSNALIAAGLKSVGDTSASPDWNAALKCTKALIAKYPEFAWGYYELGTVYENTGFTDDAISTFQQEIKLDPNDSDPWRKLGKIYQDKGKFTQADYAFSQAISLCQKEAESAPAGERKLRLLTKLGGIYRDAGKPDRWY